MQLSGARVLVTGGSRGIGERIARRCAAAGADVAIVARSRDALAKVAADTGGRAYEADLGDPTTVAGLVARVEADGPIDVLVNNAAIDVTGRFCDLPPGEIGRISQTNLATPMDLCRQVIPGMLARRAGHIVNVSSLGGTNALPGFVAYSATKAGLSHFTACLRAELRGTPIGTTLVQIGPTQTDMWDSVISYPPAKRAVDRLRRFGIVVDLDPDAVAAATVDAVARGRRHVRMPKRDVLFPLLVEAPRRITEVLLTGVKTGS